MGKGTPYEVPPPLHFEETLLMFPVVIISMFLCR